MPMVTPTLNLPQPVSTSSAAPKTAVAAPAPAPAPAAPIASQAKMPDAPSTTVTLSPQAMSALASSGHPSTSSTSAPDAHDGSVYESLKNGISAAVADVGDAIADGAHAVVDGIETAVSTANKIATGIVELPFAAVAKASDAVGALIDEL